MVDSHTKNDKKALVRLNSLRGIFAVLIVIGHCSSNFDEELLPLLLCHKLNMVWVSFFFIMSGWGLCRNFHERDGYLRGFLLRKPLKLFAISLISVIVYRLIMMTVGGRAFFTKPFVVFSFNWYVYEMILFYCLFFFIYRLKMRSWAKLLILTILSALVSVITWTLSHDNDISLSHSYYYSSMAFAYGVAIGEYNQYPEDGKPRHRSSRIQRICGLIVLGSIGLISSLSLITPKDDWFFGIIVHNLAGISLISLLIVVGHNIDFDRVPILKSLSRYSPEIYLYQFLALDFFGIIYKRLGVPINLLYVVIVVLSTLLMAFIVGNVRFRLEGIIHENRSHRSRLPV